LKNEEYTNGEFDSAAHADRNNADTVDVTEDNQPTLDPIFNDLSDEDIFPAVNDDGEPKITEELICEDLLGYEGKDIEAILDQMAEETTHDEEVIEEVTYEFKESEELICEDLRGYEEHEADSVHEKNEDESEDNPSSDGEEILEPDEEVADENITEGDSKNNDDEKTSYNPEQDNAEKPRRVDTLFDFMEVCIFTLAAVFMLMSFFFRYSIVDGGSMMNTLHHQERLLLTSFLYTPECGDVVVIQDKTSALKDPIVKRIIAVGGQTVKFTRTDVYVDGIKLDEPYVYTQDYTNSYGMPDVYRYSVYPSDELLDLVVDYVDGVYYEIRVPEGEIFVMGDHRNNSRDSRDIGTLHEDAIIGRVVYRFFPFDKFGKIE
jgi:signal peptidase I